MPRNKSTRNNRRSRWDDDAPTAEPVMFRPHRREDDDYSVAPLDLPPGSRWSTWDDIDVSHGPDPVPDWVVTTEGAVDHERGIVKTGKEADVFLVERSVPDTGIGVLMAAKRYRSSEHRMFHRDAGYVEGRRVRESRMNRAMGKRTGFGRELLAGQWASAEFDVLGQMHTLGAPVPYPVQLAGTELLIEFIGDADGSAAPRLAQVRADDVDLPDLWAQCVEAMALLAGAGWAHGDLSAYNLLVHGGRLVMIDLPQAINIVANPRGPEFLRRDVANVGKWFAGRGLDVAVEDVLVRLLDEAHMLGR